MIEYLKTAIKNRDEFSMLVILNRLVLLEGEEKSLDIFKKLVDEVYKKN